MYVVIWEYHVKAERIAEFEQIYRQDGRWAELFKNGDGFVSTELLRDEANPQKYMTIDRWKSAEDYETFLTQWREQYEALDVRCEGLTEQESLLGKWETVNYETR